MAQVAIASLPVLEHTLDTYAAASDSRASLLAVPAATVTIICKALVALVAPVAPTNQRFVIAHTTRHRPYRHKPDRPQAIAFTEIGYRHSPC